MSAVIVCAGRVDVQPVPRSTLRLVFGQQNGGTPTPPLRLRLSRLLQCPAQPHLLEAAAID